MPYESWDGFLRQHAFFPDSEYFSNVQKRYFLGETKNVSRGYHMTVTWPWKTRNLQFSFPAVLIRRRLPSCVLQTEMKQIAIVLTVKKLRAGVVTALGKSIDWFHRFGADMYIPWKSLASVYKRKLLWRIRGFPVARPRRQKFLQNPCVFQEKGSMKACSHRRQIGIHLEWMNHCVSVLIRLLNSGRIPIRLRCEYTFIFLGGGGNTPPQGQSCDSFGDLGSPWTQNLDLHRRIRQWMKLSIWSCTFLRYLWKLEEIPIPGFHRIRILFLAYATLGATEKQGLLSASIQRGHPHSTFFCGRNWIMFRVGVGVTKSRKYDAYDNKADCRATHSGRSAFSRAAYKPVIQGDPRNISAREMW